MMNFRPVLPALIATCFITFPLQAAQLNTGSTLGDVQPATLPSAPQKFDPVIDDLPLMDGLAPVPDEATIFVTPHAGRIADSTVKGVVDIDDVYRYYKRSLPHLGWQFVDNRTYRRGGDTLRIAAHAEGKVTTVRFSIRPE